MIPMKKQPFYFLLGAQTISALGDAFGLIAMEWLVYELTGSKLAMGTLALMSGVSEILCRLLGAPLIDRVNRVRLMVLLDIVRALAFALPVVLGALGHLQLWHLFVTALLSGSCSALFGPASMAVLPSLVQGEKLVRAHSFSDMAVNGSYLLGPTLAGVLIALHGAQSALAVDAVSFLLSAALLFLLPKERFIPKARLAQPTPALEKSSGLSRYLRDMGQGIQFFKNAPALFIILCFASVSNMSGVAVWTMMVPYVQEHLAVDAAKFGLLGTANAVGMISGAFLVGVIGDVQRRRLPMLGSVLVRGCLVAAMGLTGSYWVLLALVFSTGLTGPFFGSFSSSLFGRLVPEELRGRVQSIRMLVGGCLQPAGGFAGSLVATSLGMPVLFLLAGLTPALMACGGFFLPALMGIVGDLSDRLPTSTPTPTPAPIQAKKTTPSA
jgi:MFS family permease